MDMSLDSLTDVYNDYSDMYSQRNDKTSALKDKLSSTDYSTVADDELMEVCKDFEAYFTEQVFKALERMVPKSEESSSSTYMDYFGDTLTQEYAKSATEQGGGLGIAQMLYEQMKRNYGIDTVPEVANAGAAADYISKETENSTEQVQ
jgi:flagellar protein FlgJ